MKPVSILAVGLCLIPGLHAPRAQQATPATRVPLGANAVGDSSGTAALRRLSGICRQDAARYCPALGRDAGGRELAICLKYYKIDLSYLCRKQLQATMR